MYSNDFVILKYKSYLVIYHIIGRLHISGLDGVNSQGLIQNLHAYGGRSVSMWNPATFQRVYDTGDDLEKQAKNKYSTTFNGDCNNLNLSPAGEMDLRSDDYVSKSK